MDYNINITNNGYVQINGKLINEVVFNQELVDYNIREREELIDDLLDLYSSVKESDKELVKEDIKYLQSLDDKYVLSSIYTNEYIAKSDNPNAFNEIIEDILLKDSEVEEKDTKRTGD